MLHYESISLRVLSKRSRDYALWECALNLLPYINLPNCSVKFAQGKESRTIDILACFIMNASMRATKWNVMHIYKISILYVLEVRDI